MWSCGVVAPSQKINIEEYQKPKDVLERLRSFKYGVVWLPLKNHHLSWIGFWKWHFRAYKFQDFLVSLPPDPPSDLRLLHSLPPPTQISSYGHAGSVPNSSCLSSRLWPPSCSFLSSDWFQSLRAGCWLTTELSLRSGRWRTWRSSTRKRHWTNTWTCPPTLASPCSRQESRICFAPVPWQRKP